MTNLISVLKLIWDNHGIILDSSIAILSALIVIFALIPGSEPENTLQKVVDFIKKFSKK